MSRVNRSALESPGVGSLS